MAEFFLGRSTFVPADETCFYASEADSAVAAFEVSGPDGVVISTPPRRRPASVAEYEGGTT